MGRALPKSTFRPLKLHAYLRESGGVNRFRLKRGNYVGRIYPTKRRKVVYAVCTVFFHILILNYLAIPLKKGYLVIPIKTIILAEYIQQNSTKLFVPFMPFVPFVSFVTFESWLVYCVAPGFFNVRVTNSGCSQARARTNRYSY